MYNQQNHQLIEQNRFYLKKSLKSPVTLILGVVLALTCVLTLAYYLSFEMDFNELKDLLAYKIRINFFPCYEDARDFYNSATEFYLFCTLFVPFLSFLGYSLVFIGSNKKSGTPRAGSVFLIISAAISLFGTLCIQIMYMCSLQVYTKALNSSYSDEAESMFFRVTFVLIAYILYSISNLIFSCSVSKMCKGKKRSGGGSIFFGISSLLVAIGYISLALDLSENAEHFTDSETLFFAVLLSSAFAYALSATMAFIFRGLIKQNYVSESDMQPAAPVYPQDSYGYPAYQYPVAEPNPPYNPPYQNTDYQNSFTSDDILPQPTYNPIEDIQPTPAPSTPAESTPAAVSAPVPVRKAEDGFTIDKDFVGDVPAFCPECGSPVKPQQSFCANCGKKLN